MSNIHFWMLLNLSYCVVLLSFAIFAFWRAIYFYSKTTIWLITYCSKTKICLTVYYEKIRVQYVLPLIAPYLCNVMYWYTCVLFTYITKQALSMAQGDTRGVRNLRQLYWNCTVRNNRYPNLNISGYYRI